MSDFAYSDIEKKIICDQVERRAKYRKEFLKLRTDPCQHSKEAGHVFDPAIQRFMSMKTSQFDHFQATPRTATMGLCFVVLPMLVYGYAVWTQRSQFLAKCRSGELKYRDRNFKLQ